MATGVDRHVLGQRVAYWRVQRQLTQQELADRLGETVTSAFLTHIAAAPVDGRAPGELLRFVVPMYGRTIVEAGHIQYYLGLAPCPVSLVDDDDPR